MKAYPSIPLSTDSRSIGEPCIGFYKYDGSNLRWEWSKKQGWHKFGTRTRLFGKDEEPYNQAIPLFLETMGDALISKVTANFHVQDFIVYINKQNTYAPIPYYPDNIIRAQAALCH